MVKARVWNPWHTARSAPSRIAVIADDASCTFAELVRTADAIGSGLAAHGLPEGAVLSTDIPSGPLLFSVILAARRYGYGLFPIDDAIRGELRAGQRRDAGCVLHVTAAETGEPGTTPVSTLIESGTRHGPVPPASRAGFLLFSTSGTTGEPVVVPQPRPSYPYRGVVLVERYHAGLEKGPHVMTNPTFHLGTLNPALYALQAGSTVIVQREWSAAGFAELADRHRPDSAFLSPDRLIDLVTTGIAPRRPPRVVFHGGSACTPHVKRGAIELLGPVVHEFYGTSAGIVTEIDAPEWLRHPGSVGRPMFGCRVSIMAGGHEVPQGEVGEVYVGTHGAREGHPPVRTGDLGYVERSGHLFLLGRVSDSDRWENAWLEQGVRILPGVVETAVLDTPEGALCLVESTPAAPGDLAGRIGRLASGKGIRLSRVDIRPAGSFGRTRSGKLRHVPAS